MTELFRAYGVRDSKIPTYFIDSTAPNNVDDPLRPPSLPAQLFPIDADEAIEKISGHLSSAAEPNLVIMVHGYNNPLPNVLEMYANASSTIEGDRAISSRQGLVCVGYRWPSEHVGAPLRSSWAALPSLPRWVFWLGVVLALCGLVAIVASLPVWPLRHWWAATAGHVLAIAGLAVAGLVLCAFLLRVVVYFRDTFRATNYGAPDLIDIVRQIDREILEHDTPRHGNDKAAATEHRRRNRVQLSFVGHSMGGYVVTNTIRVLSDAFAKDAMRPRLNAGVINETNVVHFTAGDATDILPNIGNAFSLMRFVLAAPDIPAEALLSNRANFLASSLRRFREAYLFSNEGDEVLRQVSTLANYFSFPTKTWQFGFRLGNVEILRSGYGIETIAPDSLLTSLRVGYCTLQELYDALRKGREEQDSPRFETVQDQLPKVFSYFDCTDYVEPDANGVRRGLLTFALQLKRRNPAARMSWLQHAKLLAAYLFRGQKPDVHGGYFQGALSQQLMYRLACLGFADAVAAFGGATAMSKECKDKQIRALLSPVLQTKSEAARTAVAALAPAQPRQ